MMRTLKLLALSGIAFLMGACSDNSIDSKLDEYEAAVDEYVESVQKQVDKMDKDDDPTAGIELIATSGKLLDKTSKLSKELDERKDEMTDEQQERMLKIAMKATMATVPAEQREMMNNMSSPFGLGE